MSELPSLKNVTLVIPSYKRQDYLLRNIAYWYPTGVNLILLDGSPNSFSPIILNSISLNSRITYIHSNTSFEDRLNQAVSYVSTPYVASLSDDEFFLKSSLFRLISKLESSPHLSGIIGQSLSFNYNPSLKKVEYSMGYPHWGYQAEHPNIRDRLKYAFNNYNATTAYGIFKKDTWVNGWGRSNIYSCVYTTEIYQAIATYICGGYLATNDFFWLRSDENHPIETTSWDRKLRFHEWWKSPLYRTERDQFTSSLSRLIETKLGLNKESSEEIIFEAIDEYLHFCKKRFNISFRKKSQHTCLLILKKTLPKPIFQYLKKIYRSNFFTADLTVSSHWPNHPQAENIQESHHDLKEIETLIEEFYIAKNLDKIESITPNSTAD